MSVKARSATDFSLNSLISSSLFSGHLRNRSWNGLTGMALDLVMETEVPDLTSAVTNSCIELHCIKFSSCIALYMWPIAAHVVCNTEFGIHDESATCKRYSAIQSVPVGGKACPCSLHKCARLVKTLLYEFNVLGAKQNLNRLAQFIDHPSDIKRLFHIFSKRKVSTCDSGAVPVLCPLTRTTVGCSEVLMVGQSTFSLDFETRFDAGHLGAISVAYAFCDRMTSKTLGIRQNGGFTKLFSRPQLSWLRASTPSERGSQYRLLKRF